MKSFCKTIQMPVGTEPIFRKLDEIYTDLEDNVLRVWGRRDVLLVLDLVYHSVLSFAFRRQLMKRGWMDVIVPGDAGTAKSTIAERMIAHNRCGELRLGESVSVAGLIGGVDKIGDRSVMKWGVFPRCDGKLIIIDEAHALSPEVFGALTGVRSSGMAEVTKIVQMRAKARVRKLWICNPRDEHPNIATFNCGILVVPSIIQRSEDIRRFDLAVIAAEEDVPKQLINEAAAREPVPHRYTSELCSRLVRWAWSRHAHQVIIPKSTEVVATVLGEELAARYAPELPLMLDAEAPQKITRMAVALAARLFSTDRTRTKVIVLPEHVHAVSAFIRYVYDKPSCKFLEWSRPRLRNIEVMRGQLKKIGRINLLVLLEHESITSRLIQDIMIDKTKAHEFYRFLIRHGGLERRGGKLMKRKEFVRLLHEVIADPSTQDEPMDDHGYGG